MECGMESPMARSRKAPVFGIGTRLTTCVVVVFFVTLIVFVGLDLHHEARFAAALGADPTQRGTLFANTLVLHSVHAAVTVLAFALAIHLVVRRLVSRRIAGLVRSIEHFRRGTWRVRVPKGVSDEIEGLTEAFRQLGPDLEHKLTTFVEADRKSVVALLGSRYERQIAPPTRAIIDAARNKRDSKDTDPTWREVENQALKILAELGRLGRPEHPIAADIVTLRRMDRTPASSQVESVDLRSAWPAAEQRVN